MSVVPASGTAPLRVGVNVPYSAEFRDTTSNDALLASLAAQSPQGGAPGRVVDVAADVAPAKSDASLFRHDLAKATSRQSCWHFVLLAGACLFFFDVLNRRVAISSHDLSSAAEWLARFVPWQKAAPAPASLVMNRLRARKQSIAQQLDDRRAAAQFEPPSPLPDAEFQEPSPDVQARTTPAAAPPQVMPDTDEESYTSRLLKAKRRALEKH